MKSSFFIRVPQVLAAVFILLFAAGAQQTSDTDNHGIVAANMDTSVKPGNNFYEFCNGAWLKRTEIPGDRAAVGVFSNPCRHQQQKYCRAD